MWLGFLVGVIYALTGFRGEGKPPRLACTCGPFRKGMLYYRGMHIHHWMFCAPLSLIAILISAWNFAAFCAVMTLHGISYSDAFKLRDEKPSTEAATVSSPPPPHEHTQEPTTLEIHADGGE